MPKKRKKATKATGPKGVNWANLRTEYVVSDGLSLAALADRHKIAPTTVFRESAAGNWPKLREARQEQDASETLAKLQRELRGELAKRTRVHLLGVRATLSRLWDDIAKGKRTGRMVTDPKTGEKVEEREPLNAQSLDKAALASERLVKVERLILGEVEGRTEQRGGMTEEEARALVDQLADVLEQRMSPEDTAEQIERLGLVLLSGRDGQATGTEGKG